MHVAFLISTSFMKIRDKSFMSNVTGGKTVVDGKISVVKVVLRGKMIEDGAVGAVVQSGKMVGKWTIVLGKMVEHLIVMLGKVVDISTVVLGKMGEDSTVVLGKMVEDSVVVLFGTGSVGNVVEDEAEKTNKHITCISVLVLITRLCRRPLCARNF